MTWHTWFELWEQYGAYVCLAAGVLCVIVGHLMRAKYRRMIADRPCTFCDSPGDQPHRSACPGLKARMVKGAANVEKPKDGLKFKVGSWVRRAGVLTQVIELGMHAKRLYRVHTGPDGIPDPWVSEEELKWAIPHDREVWEQSKCGAHSVARYTGDRFNNDPEATKATLERVKCGCLKPVNFGRGAV